MGITSLPQSISHSQGHVESSRGSHHEKEWVGVAVGGTLLLGSVLLISGKRRAGLMVTAAGTALALLEEQETVRSWWNALPQYLEIGFVSSHGNSVSGQPASQNSGQIAAIQINGVSGATHIYRP